MKTTTSHTISIDVRTQELAIEERSHEESEYSTATRIAFTLARIALTGRDRDPEIVARCLEQGAALVRKYSAALATFEPLVGADDEVFLAFANAHDERILAELGSGFLGRHITVAASDRATN